MVGVSGERSICSRTRASDCLISRDLHWVLRGMLSGMAGFVVFCLLVAVLADRAGVAVTFTTAALAAVAVQAATARASALRLEGVPA